MYKNNSGRRILTCHFDSCNRDKPEFESREQQVKHIWDSHRIDTDMLKDDLTPFVKNGSLSHFPRRLMQRHTFRTPKQSFASTGTMGSSLEDGMPNRYVLFACMMRHCREQHDCFDQARTLALMWGRTYTRCRTRALPLSAHATRRCAPDRPPAWPPNRTTSPDSMTTRMQKLCP
jgi:hypothetical protein